MRVSSNGNRCFHRVAAREAIKAQARGGLFIDLRHPTGVQELVPLGFKNIPHFELDNEIRKGDTLKPTESIYLADTWGYYSEQCATLLEQNGFTNVNVISGGIISWGTNGGPLAPADARKKAEIEKKYNSKF